MKEFIEKLIGRLEELYNSNDKMKKKAYEEQDWENFELFTHGNEGVKESIEIVNQLAEEYKDKEYCWQSCASTEHCKECSRLGNGDIDFFESIDDWTDSLPTIDAGELLGNGWIPCSERLPRIGEQVMVCNTYGSVFVSHITYLNPRVDKNGECHDFGSHYKVIAWQPLPAPYQPKGE